MALAFAVSGQEGGRGTRNRKTEGRTDESERTRSWRRITGTADEGGREERARAWTVEAADGTEERRGTGEDGGGIIRPGSLSFFRLLLCVSLPHHLNEDEEEEDEAGRMSERRGAALWSLVVGRSAARCGDVVAMTSPRSGRGGRPSFPRVLTQAGEVVSVWRWCGR